MKPYLMKRSTGYKSISQKENIDFKYLMKTGGHLTENDTSKYYKKILIFTRRSDDEVTLLGPLLLAQGIDYFRVDVEDFVNDFEIKISIPKEGKDTFQIMYKDETLTSDDVDTIWFRHFDSAALTDKQFGSEELLFIRHQWNRIIDYLSEFNGINVINSPLKFNELTKPRQLDLAKKSGFKTIPSVITNSIQAIKEVINKDNYVFVKSVDHHFLEVDENQYMELYGGKVNSVPEEDEIKSAPAIFQPMLLGTYEVRATVVGKEIFASKQLKPITDDWHKENMQQLHIERVELPKQIINKINKFSKYSGLTMYSVDFFVTDDVWVFVEANVQGDWNWVEERTKMPISQAISKMLMHI